MFLTKEKTVKITDITSKQVIHCPTREVREQILKLAEDAGFSFYSEKGRANFLNCEYGDKTYLNIKGEEYMVFSPMSFYLGGGFDLIEYQRILGGWFFGHADSAGIWGYCGSNLKIPNDKPITKTIEMNGGGGSKGWWCYIGPLLEAPVCVPTYTEWTPDLSKGIPKELYIGEPKYKINVSSLRVRTDGTWSIETINENHISSTSKFYTLDQ